AENRIEGDVRNKARPNGRERKYDVPALLPRQTRETCWPNESEVRPSREFSSGMRLAIPTAKGETRPAARVNRANCGPARIRRVVVTLGYERRIEPRCACPCRDEFGDAGSWTERAGTIPISVEGHTFAGSNSPPGRLVVLVGIVAPSLI